MNTHPAEQETDLINTYNQKAVELARDMGLDPISSLIAFGQLFAVSALTAGRNSNSKTNEVRQKAHGALDAMFDDILAQMHESQPHG